MGLSGGHCGRTLWVLCKSTRKFNHNILEGNVVGFWGVFCKSTYWVLVGVNCVYIVKDIKPHPLGLSRVNQGVNYKSNLKEPGGFVPGTLFQNSS